MPSLLLPEQLTVSNLLTVVAAPAPEAKEDDLPNHVAFLTNKYGEASECWIFAKFDVTHLKRSVLTVFNIFQWFFNLLAF